METYETEEVDMMSRVGYEEEDVRQDDASEAATQASREEVDSRSVFVNNGGYYSLKHSLTLQKLIHVACTPEEVQQHFESCGTVNRVTIRSGGFAYVEFLGIEAVQEALKLNESELHGRQLKVLAKRTNYPGMRQSRPRYINPYIAYQYGGAVRPPFFYPPYGYGRFPRYRRPNRYRPYN
ncbi:Polyadenylate-binding protein [Thalictrum thalictroides]|uniref:Polyadenylate-binding protein n=1 Tax=Thalictrum thalictroides TaxID=46969 RepID=A0A7J6WRI2_THATH|nr:Polyadenylate-binding protein [Thalictrum thalictroides]